MPRCPIAILSAAALHVLALCFSRRRTLYNSGRNTATFHSHTRNSSCPSLTARWFFLSLHPQGLNGYIRSSPISIEFLMASVTYRQKSDIQSNIRAGSNT